MVDYSKWKNIEISDDEDETHPNIDTGSLFRWRHQARVERMEEKRRETEDLERNKREHDRKLAEARRKVADAEKAAAGPGPSVDELRKALRDLEDEAEAIRAKEEDLAKKEKSTPWNVDTISRAGFTKTLINKEEPRKRGEELTDEQREENMRKFIKENEKLLKKFGLLRKYDDSKAFLQQHPQLVGEETANYLVIWCINLEMEGKHDLMEHVAHQTICMQYILELSRELQVDPRACVGSFFSKIQVAVASYKESFDDELRQFKLRIEKRAKEKIAEAEKEAEAEREAERQARLGPGGLDPQEVFEELPEELQRCFNERNIPMLQEAIAKMSKEDATYHMKRCVASGLWVPEGGANPEENDGEAKSPEESSTATVD